MHKRILPLLILLALVIGPFAPAPSAAAASWQPKVDAWVLETAAQGETEFLVFLAEQADLSGAAALPTKAEKGAFVYQRLVETAQRSQGPVIAALEQMGVEYRSFWVVNALWVRGDLRSVQALAQRADVAHLYANPSVKLDVPVEKAPAPQSVLAIEWNITWVNAPQVWAAGYTGQGVVIGGQDTGYDWDHPALINQYRGWDGASADHNYNWHDATGGSPNLPVDPHSHGTHTMGTMLGDDGGANQIGMAPGARWIGCRNMNASGVGSAATYIACYEWFIAPTDLNGENPDTTKAPDVINNSWSCPTTEVGCEDPNALLQAVQSLRAAGIFTAHSAGNSGSACSSVDEPAAIYAESFSVGATGYQTDAIAGYSSRGPVMVDESNRAKPDISAPGSGVRSCVPGTGYGSKSGTSMAAPHVAGLVALLISAEPALRGQVDLLETIIERSAVPIVDMTCGGSPGGVPNNTYGWGRIDALAALESLELSVGKQAPPEAVQGEVITYTLSVTHTRGSDLLVGVVLTDTLPAGTEFVSATQPYTLAGDVITWQFASLALGESQQVNLAVHVVVAEGGVENRDYGAGAQDTFPTWGLPLQTSIVPHEFGLAKSAPALAVPGEVLTYTLVVSNLNYSAGLTGLVLTDTLPAGTELIAATQSYTLSGDVVTWQRPSLVAGAAWPVTLTVRVPLTFTGTVSNLDYGVTSAQVARHGAPVHTQVFALGVSKTASADWVAPGGWLTYTLAVTNLHPYSDVHEVILNDLLPDGVIFITATQPYSLTDGLVTWPVVVLAPGETRVFTLVVQTPESLAGWIVNDDYGASAQELGGKVQGQAVWTWVRRVLFLPLVGR